MKRIFVSYYFNKLGQYGHPETGFGNTFANINTPLNDAESIHKLEIYIADEMELLDATVLYWKEVEDRDWRE